MPFNDEGQQRSAIATGAARHRTRDRAAAGGGRGLAVSVADPPSTAEEPVALAAALSSDGCPALALLLDVSDAGQVEDAGAAHVERFGAWT